MAWLPYTLVAVLILVTRNVPAIKDFPPSPRCSTSTTSWAAASPEGMDLLYSPGAMFLLAILATYGLHRMSGRMIVGSWRIAGGQIWGTAIALLAAVRYARVFINSEPKFNASGLSSMPVTLAEAAAGAAGSNWPLLSSLLGALSAFTAGSDTVANLTFSLFQFSTAETIGLASRETIVASGAVGGAAGNMISVHNVVAAPATVACWAARAISSAGPSSR